MGWAPEWAVGWGKERDSDWAVGWGKEWDSESA